MAGWVKTILAKKSFSYEIEIEKSTLDIVTLDVILNCNFNWFHIFIV